MATQLNPNGTLVQLGRIRLRTPGLVGNASLHSAGSVGMRAAESSTQALAAALANAEMQSLETIEITDLREVPAANVPTRSKTTGQLSIEMRIPDGGQEWGQVVLVSDESGVLTWHVGTRDAGERLYLIPRRIAPAGPATAQRGLIGAVGKKILKVVAFKLVDQLGRAVGEHFAARWEEQRRPYCVRSMTADNYNQAIAPGGAAVDWSQLGKGRALLLIHGTFSRSHIAFGGCDRETMARLCAHYEGRVAAFDHFTLSVDPHANLKMLLASIPDGLALDLDIICHSRGGLLARGLAEQLHLLPLGARRIKVNRMVMVAVPNRGTALTDHRYLSELIDTYTNLLNLIPDNGVTEVLDGILSVVKHLAVGALAGLDGLQAMNPGGPFVGALNAAGAPSPTQTRYFALASDFQPPHPGLGEYAKTVLMKKVFREENDLVVPTAGVFDGNGSPRFPISDRFCFAPEAKVSHGEFFSQAETRRRILDWLTSSPDVPA